MRLSSIILTVAGATVAALPAFPQTDFQYQAYATPNNANVALNAPNAHVADFNGDGLADVLTTSDYKCSGGKCTQGVTLYLYMNNGNGLNAPVPLPVALSGGSFASEAKEVTISDFNGDGKLDIAVIDTTQGVAILYGNGDGTFKAPVYIELDQNDGLTSLVTADFDDNGTQDLGVLSQDGVLWLLYNDGKGNFTQQGVPIDSQPSGFMTTALVVGDFNADGRPDVAWVEQNNDQSQENTVWSALNTAKGIFSAKHQVGTLPIGFGDLLSADLDLDGKSDLITWTTQLVEECCSDLPVTAYYSTGSGTFTSSAVTSTITDDVGVADINGDGNPDVLIAGTAGVTVLTGSGNRTFTDPATYTSLPGGAMQLGLGFYDDTNRVGFAAPNGGANAGGYPNDLYLVKNDNTQLECPYRSGAGLYFCEALQNGNSALVRGTARAQTQPVRRIEIWANNKKMYQVFSDEFSVTLNIAPGTPVTVVEVEANGATRSMTVTPSSVQTCTAPSSPGVHTCAPTQGESTSSPVLFRAAGTGASGTVNHLELWIDGGKIGNYSGSTMEASIAASTGSHSAQVVEVDSKGAYVKSSVVDFTVGGQTGPCSAPSSPGVHVCQPTQGESSASPVSFLAAGTGASGAVNHLELWIDGTKIGNYSGGDLETSVSEPAGSHSATVIEVDSKGNFVKSSPVTYTVQ